MISLEQSVVPGGPAGRRWSLVLVLALAVLLRVPTLDRGFLHYDDAQYAFAIQPAVLELRQDLGIEGWTPLFDDGGPMDLEPAPFFALTAKPVFDLLSIPWTMLMGLTPEAISVLVALFAVATVALVWRVTATRFGIAAGVTAALILAISKYHIYYSAAQTPAIFSAFFLFLTAGLYLGTIGGTASKRLALTGASLAAAFGAHYNLLPYILIFAGIEVLHAARFHRRDLRAAGLRILVYSTGFLAVIGVFEIFYRWLADYAYTYLPDVRRGYMAQLHFQMGFFDIVTSSGFDRFGMLLLDSEGVVVLILAVLGLAANVRRMFTDHAVLTLALLPLLHLVAATLAGLTLSPVFPRMTVMVLPFIALWAGVGTTYIVAVVSRHFGRPPRPILAAALVVVILLAIPGSWRVANLRNGFPDAAAIVRSHGGKEVALGQPVEQYYLGSFDGVAPLPTSVEELQRLATAEGFGLIVIDQRVNVLADWQHPLAERVRRVEGSLKPIATIDNPAGREFLVNAENAISRRSLRSSLEDPRSGLIRIYDLPAFVEALQR